MHARICTVCTHVLLCTYHENERIANDKGKKNCPLKGLPSNTSVTPQWARYRCVHDNRSVFTHAQSCRHHHHRSTAVKALSERISVSNVRPPIVSTSTNYAQMERETAHLLITGTARSQQQALWCGVGREGGTLWPRTTINRNWICIDSFSWSTQCHTFQNKALLGLLFI